MWPADTLSNNILDDCCPSVDQYIIYNMVFFFHYLAITISNYVYVTGKFVPNDTWLCCGVNIALHSNITEKNSLFKCLVWIFFLRSFSSVHKTHFHLCLWFCIFPHETRRICQCLRKTDKPMKLSSCDANLLSVLQERHTLLFAFEKNQLLIRIQLRRRLYPQKSLICQIPWDDLLTYCGHQILTPGGSEWKVTDSVRRSFFHFWRVSLSVITFFLFSFPYI